MTRSLKFAATLATFAAVALGRPSVALASDWKWSVTPYAWATDVGADVQVEDRQVVDETIPVQDLMEDLDTIAQVRAEAQRGSFGLFFDLFDVNLSDDAQTVTLPAGAGELTLAPEMGMTILEVGAFYDPNGDQRGFQILYGARALNERATIGAEIRRADGSTGARDLEVDDRLVDALVGLRYIRPLGDRFTTQVQADLSLGGTELSWSAETMMGYSFGAHRRTTATAGYRYMVVDFATTGKVDARMTLSGFVAGLRFAF